MSSPSYRKHLKAVVQNDFSSHHYKKTFYIRFFGYFFTFFGSAVIIFQFGPVGLAEYNYRFDQLFNVHYSLADVTQNLPTGATPDASSNPTGGSGSGFGTVTNTPKNVIKPVSTDYGIVIEKINANSKVVADVDPSNEKQYTDALAVGVAATSGSTPPGQPGNLYIFSHSVDAPWNVARYNAVFYLLRELKVGDNINIFYQGRRYDYQVFDKTVVNPKDLTFLNNRYDKPVLTLQTCDPPGTILNRLIVRAQLVGS